MKIKSSQKAIFLTQSKKILHKYINCLNRKIVGENMFYNNRAKFWSGSGQTVCFVGLQTCFSFAFPVDTKTNGNFIFDNI